MGNKDFKPASFEMGHRNNGNGGKLIASAEDGNVQVDKGYDSGSDKSNGHGHTNGQSNGKTFKSCSDRLRPENSNVLVELIYRQGRGLRAKVVEVINPPTDGKSPSPAIGSVLDILNNVRTILAEDRRGAWGGGSRLVVTTTPNADSEWQKKGYSEHIVVLAHIWCCSLKSLSKRVAPPSPAELAERASVARIITLKQRLNDVVAAAKERGVTGQALSASATATEAFNDFRVAMQNQDESTARAAIERLEAVVQKMFPSEMAKAAMRNIAAELPANLGDLFADAASDTDSDDSA